MHTPNRLHELRQRLGLRTPISLEQAIHPTIRVGRPYQRAKTSALQYAREVLKFVRSPHDLTILCQKVAYLTPRTTGIFGRSTNVPPSLQIEPTNLCNVRCICCPVATSTRPRGFMDFELFQAIIDDAAQCGVKRIRLFLHGEPMLHPRIVEMIAYAKSRRLAVHLTTNGVLLDRARIEAILRSGVDCADHFTFSILGYSAEVHERVMRRASHERVIQNVFDFLELRARLGVNGPVIETIFYAMPENLHEEQQYLHYWQGIVDHARLGGRISESFADYHQSDRPVPIRTRTCANLWERMTVLWNGDVALCCQDVDGNYILGNLREQSIQQVWSCEQLAAIKQLHRERRFQEFPFCASCDM